MRAPRHRARGAASRATWSSAMVAALLRRGPRRRGAAVLPVRRDRQQGAVSRLGITRVRVRAAAAAGRPRLRRRCSTASTSGSRWSRCGSAPRVLGHFLRTLLSRRRRTSARDPDDLAAQPDPAPPAAVEPRPGPAPSGRTRRARSAPAAPATWWSRAAAQHLVLVVPGRHGGQRRDDRRDAPGVGTPWAGSLITAMSSRTDTVVP